MKTSLLILLILNSLFLFPQNGTFWQNPFPSGTHLEAVEFISSTTGWTVGSEGVLLKTTDGGTNWTEFQTGSVFYYLKGVKFFNSYDGIAIAYEDMGSTHIVLRSSDAGESWNVIHTLYSSVNDFTFVNNNVGYAVGQHIHKTTDGGITWFNQTTYSANHLGVYAADINTVTAVGYYGIIYHTTDGGINWYQQESGTTEDLSGVFFVDKNYGIITGSSGTILKTTNGGAVWVNITSGTSKWLRKVSFSGTGTGIIAGDDGVILRTSNGGTNWSNQISGTTQHLRDIHLSDINNGTAVGDYSTIIRTSNGGITWYPQSKLFTIKTLRGVSCINENVAAAVGKDGEIIRTTNGGSTWLKQTSGVTVDLHGVSFADINKGIVVGDEGTILHTTNGGGSWNRWNSNITNNFYSVSFVKNSNTAYAAGNKVIYKTADGGSNWTEVYNNPNSNLSGISFTNENSGTAVGWITILRTTNGGASWSVKEVNSGISLDAVSFFDANYGAMAYNTNESGGVYVTTDGGANWNSQSSYQDIHSVSMTGPNNISAVGGGKNGEGSCGVIMHSTDGGNTWLYSNNCRSVHRFFGLSLSSSGYGFVVGEYGAILKINDSSIPVEFISFTVFTDENGIILSWETATETNNRGFEVERRSSESDFMLVKFVAGYGTSSEPKSYQYIDQNLTTGIYAYRLKQIDYNGSFDYSNEIEIVFNSAPKEFVLEQCYPNPFNPATKISFSIPVQQVVELKVYDVLGNEVALITREYLPPGTYEREWRGDLHTSGVYYYRLTAGDFVQTKKMILMK